MRKIDLRHLWMGTQELLEDFLKKNKRNLLPALEQNLKQQLITAQNRSGPYSAEALSCAYCLANVAYHVKDYEKAYSYLLFAVGDESDRQHEALFRIAKLLLKIEGCEPNIHQNEDPFRLHVSFLIDAAFLGNQQALEFLFEKFHSDARYRSNMAPAVWQQLFLKSSAHGGSPAGLWAAPRSGGLHQQLPHVCSLRKSPGS